MKDLIINVILDSLHFFDENLVEPAKQLALQPRKPRAWQRKGVCFPILPRIYELCLVFSVQFSKIRTFNFERSNLLNMLEGEMALESPLILSWEAWKAQQLFEYRLKEAFVYWVHPSLPYPCLFSSLNCLPHVL